MDETKPSLWQTITRLCKEHPVVGPLGVLGAIASIVAIPLAIALWIWPTVPKRELTYAIQPVRTSIVQVNRQSDIAVTYRGTPIIGDLTAAQVMIANAGDLPIEESDILSPLVLVISNATYVETSMSVQAKQGTVFLPIPIKEGVHLNWKTLERGDSPVIQILYAGKRDAPITLEGRIKGQNSIKQVAWSGAFPAKSRILVSVFAGGILIGTFSMMFARATNRKQRVFYLACLLVGMGIGCWVLLHLAKMT